ncbi:MAG: 3-hydroxyacyl-CoA dehydrogenase NAD-binding domain-containing protein [Betaproteobacteria bacterium]|jgi:3-hydroxyacyl-CoA dehydrogenase|nr:enoyl-CoA hydratase/isomerase family protein [Rhodocyclaceae bacterium]MCA3143971.1 enoyl-CoA hydratase/isomerase family protein [Rhodocyclaceae bacterium]MCE2898560.1 3-hydroxyacyl-CoA dehydrogenase NAD-binding domain-containing protein [Betaproteobacteria bacterium]
MAIVDYRVQNHVGVITLNNPPVNALSVGKGLLQGILDAIKEGEHDTAVKAFLLIGGGRNFSGGADITEFGKPPVPGMATLRDVLSYMDTVTKPICAALAGPTMGGGLELALGAHWRCAVTGAQIGLPEVKLGILPGAAGTQRLPRLIGAATALDMMVSGDPVSTERAHELGIVDEIVEGDLAAAALKFAQRVVKEGRPIRRISAMTVAVEGDADAFFAEARARIATQWRGYPAPLEIAACVEAAVQQPFAKGVAFERERFEVLVATSESKSLRHAFFAERAAAKVNGLPEDTPVREIRSAAVIGAGTMGGGIAMNFANAGIPVKILEASPERLDKGLSVIRANYAATVSKGRLSQEAMDKRMALMTGVSSYDDLRDADIIIEAVFEEMPVKQEVFRTLDAVAKPGAILATNTSTLDIDAIAAVTARPQDVIGLHFFSPANVMKLLEIVRGAKTGGDVIATSMKLAKTIRKVGALVGVCDGFVGNRMVHAYFREAGYLLEEGALPQQVDRVMEAFGFAMGPFRVSDLAGLDIGWAIRKRQAATRDPAERYSRIADLICEQGRFGQKTGAGYYRYEGSRKPVPDPAIEALIVQASKDGGFTRREISDQEILERCLYQLVNVGAQILEEGIAQRASDIDIIYLYGYGYPRYRGGPMMSADLIGLPKVLEAVKGYEQRVGQWWKPAALLERLAAEGKGFNG